MIVIHKLISYNTAKKYVSSHYNEDCSMMQYLLDIKAKVDTITMVRSLPDSKDILLYALNGLPFAYQVLKIAIYIKFSSIRLEYLYSLLCSEDLNLAIEASCELISHLGFDSHPILIATIRQDCACSFHPSFSIG